MEKKYTLNCLFCDEEFESSNLKRKYCKNTCKTYASNERKGKLNQAQSNIRGPNQVYHLGKSYTVDYVLEHLKSYFSARCYIDKEHQAYYRDNYKLALRDKGFNVNNVKSFNEDSYLLSSVDYNYISHLKDRFQGSPLFSGVVKVLSPFPSANYEMVSLSRTIVTKANIILTDKLQIE